MALGGVKFRTTMDTKSMRATLQNLNSFVDKVAGRTLRGMVAAAFGIKNASVRMTPIEFGNLRGSAFVVWADRHMSGVRPEGMKRQPFRPKANPSDPSAVDSIRLTTDHSMVTAQLEMELERDISPGVYVGHSAYYAIYVHEDEEAHHEQGSAKFLEKAYRLHRHSITTVIAKEAAGLAFDTRQLFRKRFNPDGTVK